MSGLGLCVCSPRKTEPRRKRGGRARVRLGDRRWPAVCLVGVPALHLLNHSLKQSEKRWVCVVRRKVEDQDLGC